MDNTLDRFSDPSKRIVIAALDEAARSGSQDLSPEFLLLALSLDGDSVCVAALQQTGTRAGRLRLAVEAVLRNSAGPRIGTDDVIPGPRIQQVFEWAAEEASQVDLAARILPCHLLLGILREEQGAAYETLHRLGVPLEETRAAVASALQSPEKSGRTDVPKRVPHPSSAPAPTGGYQVRRFSEPEAASAWLTELEQDGVILEFSGASDGAIWVIVHCKPGQ